jgi:hypothetical protein
LEKLVPSVPAATRITGAKTLDYSIGADFGMYCLTGVKAVTEIVALHSLFGVEATLVAAGGVGGCEGAVVLVITGADAAVQSALGLVEQIKGEPAVAGRKGTCAVCRYSCRFAGKPESDLPAWLRRSESTEKERAAQG